MQKLAIASLLFFASSTLGGCALGVAAGAGYVAHDEATENDGNFDPLEEVRGEGDGKN
ncbi:hypothetical protein [Hyphococcus sp. DH-69]|uniref:hypothetical protein n=1 Tax=Hyphococcus formosus TaxID=3143534 RepID=UPI00398AD0E5